MKRATGLRPMSAAAAENYEHMLTCLICRSLFDDHDHQPKFLPCHHTFCKECLREYVRQMGDDIECPSCRKVATIPAAGVTALQTNFYAKYIQTLVYGGGSAGAESDLRTCDKHTSYHLKYFCDDCSVALCDVCIEQSECRDHHRSPIAAVAERFRQNIDASFSTASTVIGRKKAELEGRLRALADEKDRALLRIDSAFEAHAHTLARRATLLKNKVIDIYNENSSGLEAGLEDVDTAMTCVVSLREYYEAAVDRGDFESVSAGRGAAEIDEVAHNISDRVHPPEIHIVYDGDHGGDKFRACTKDLGRVVCNRSTTRRPDSSSSENQLQSVASGGLDSIPPSPDHFSPQEEFGAMAGISRGNGIMSCNQGDMFVTAGINSEIGGGEPAKKQMTSVVLGEDLSLISKVPNAQALQRPSSNKTVENVTFQMPAASLTNNNTYFASSRVPMPREFAGAGASAASAGNIGLGDRRAYMSYDEHQLRRELGDGLESGADPDDLLSQRMSRSDYWVLDGVAEPEDESGNGDGLVSNVVAELSGEQTTL